MGMTHCFQEIHNLSIYWNFRIKHIKIFHIGLSLYKKSHYLEKKPKLFKTSEQSSEIWKIIKISEELSLVVYQSKFWRRAGENLRKVPEIASLKATIERKWVLRLRQIPYQSQV